MNNDEQVDRAAQERFQQVVDTHAHRCCIHAALGLETPSMDDLEVSVVGYIGWMHGRIGTFLMQLPTDPSDDWVTKHARGLTLALGLGQAYLARIGEARTTGVPVVVPTCADEDVARICGEMRAGLFTVSLLLHETASEREQQAFATQRYLHHEALGARAASLVAVARMASEGAEQVRVTAAAAGTN